MVRVTDSLLPQIAADFGVTVGATSIVVTVYSLAHGSVQLVIGPIGDRFGKYRVHGLCRRRVDRDGGALRTGAFADGADRRAPRQRARRRLDHSAGAGLRRRCHPLRAAPAGARAFPVRADPRAAVRPGGGRRARRLVRLAQRVLPARRAASRSRRQASGTSCCAIRSPMRATPARSRARGFIADYSTVLRSGRGRAR